MSRIISIGLALFSWIHAKARIIPYLAALILIASTAFIYASNGSAQYNWPYSYPAIITPDNPKASSSLYYPATLSPFNTFPFINSGASLFSLFTPLVAWPRLKPQLSLINQPRAEIINALTSPVIPTLPVTTAVPTYTYAVINAYPHDRSAFTQGLLYDNGFLYEGTGINGYSSIRKVDLVTGNILQSRDLPFPYWGEGITIYGNRIIQLTWLHNTGFVYDKNSFDLLQEFSYPTQGWGLTHDGQKLIMSDGTAKLHFLNPVTLNEIGSIDVYDQDGPVYRLNELEYIRGEIYANVWLTDRIARISAVTGQVLGWIDLTGLLNRADLTYLPDVLNGIAYDAQHDRLFVTGKFWPALFEIRLVPLLP